MSCAGIPRRPQKLLENHQYESEVFDRIRQQFNWLELVWADNGYNAWQVNNAITANPGLRIEIVKRSNDMKGFVVLPRRWVVERIFSWFGRDRRLNKDYENLADRRDRNTGPRPDE
jgi:putative transposase